MYTCVESMKKYKKFIHNSSHLVFYMVLELKAQICANIGENSKKISEVHKGPWGDCFETSISRERGVTLLA